MCSGCGQPGGLCDSCRLENGEEKLVCDGCEEEQWEEDLWPQFVYLSPFDEEETDTGMKYCEDCGSRGLGDEGTFYCDRCDRTILEDRGWMTHYRILGGGEMVCLSCVQDVLLTEGIAGFEDELEDLFNRGRLFGMFFNVGELEEKGWTAHPQWENACISGEDDALALASTARTLHEQGLLIIIEYERLAIGGGEGYVTLRSKVKD